MNELALFAGAGGGILGGILNGWKTVCAVEINDYCRRVLMQRQDDGILEPFPIWDDITTFDGRPWAGCVDIVTGGFPCQDISVAGKGAGIEGERSGLWREMARIISEVRPQYVFVENSPALTIRGGVRVIGDLTEMGYDTKWGVVGADDAGAPHRRKRIWILADADNVPGCTEQRRKPQMRAEQFDGSRKAGATAMAHANSVRELQPQGGEQDKRGRISHGGEELANADSPQRKRMLSTSGVRKEHASAHSGCEWWRQDPAEDPESGMGRVADGVGNRVDRLKAVGNGQVPAVVRLAWESLK